MAYTGTSIVDYLKSTGQDSSYSARTVLAQKYGITNYTGTAEQNLKLLNLLKSGSTTTPTPTQTPTDGDTRINPQTGQLEFFNTDEIWQPVTTPGQVYGTEGSLVNNTQTTTNTTQTPTSTEEIKKQIGELESQAAALKEYNLSDTEQLIKDDTGKYIPKYTSDNTSKEDEYATALAEAEKYLGYNLPTGQSPAYYPIEYQELIDQSNLLEKRAGEDYQTNISSEEREKAKLQQEYNQYLQDVETGKARTDEDYRLDLERRLSEKQQLIDQSVLLEGRAIEDYQTNLSNIQREKANLLEDYNQYLQDLETGKVRAGTDYQRDLEKRLDEKRLYLTEQEMTTKKNLEALNRGWISRGGLWSGARTSSVGQYQSEQDLAKEKYLSGWEYGKETATEEYNRALQDYETNKLKAGTQYGQSETEVMAKLQELEQLKGRSLEDIAISKEQGLTNWQYGQTAAQNAYNRALQDYITNKNKATTQYGQNTADILANMQRYEQMKNRTVEDIALAKVKDLRSLQEKYQEAIASRMAQNLQYNYI